MFPLRLSDSVIFCNGARLTFIGVTQWRSNVEVVRSNGKDVLQWFNFISL